MHFIIKPKTARVKKVQSTQFSTFFREAKSRDKKRVYTDVLKKATERQQAVLLKRTADNASH